ncbi:MAG: hypothetical protein ACD_51C00279G0002 [uncultured bacterium]|nr:MAG: hypothetical protein ACD_51C00279G0002 [uncultured bacterium]
MDKIVIIDFGSQLAHLIADRIRRLGVYSEIRSTDIPASDLKQYKGIIISGGPASVNDPKSPQLDRTIYEIGIPILGICYGHQYTMRALGGRVAKGVVGEYGLTQFTVTKNIGVFKHLEKKSYQVYASHFDTVEKVPEGFEVVGETRDDKMSATANELRKIYTVQFHPEVAHTECGMKILDTFIEITGSKRDWSIEKFISEEVASINKKVDSKKVFMLVSGGVDSTVAYALLAKALGEDRVYAMYVDTGFMRKNETAQIKKSLEKIGIKNLHIEHAEKEFFSALKGIYEPEQKRKIIGDKFLEIQRNVAQKLNLNPDEWLLGQGTIYPDTIESGGTRNADKIKTHHNRVPEIEEMIRQGKIIEPIKELYKDEVRELGAQLGLPEEMVNRHPFPGPGLAVRCLCAEKEDGKYEKLPNGHLLPIKSVGVQGDERTYRHPFVLDSAHDWNKLRTISPSITNTDSRINRVLVEISGVKIEKVSITQSYLTPERIAKLQEADALVMDAIKDEKSVWQCPTVLIPLSVNAEGQESIVIRPVSSQEAMTANFTELPWEKVEKLAKDLMKIHGISAVFYDITNKPPATIEWE